ncbi:MAG: GDSL family lipase, partial [Pirellulaceae bacterium]|nr:GDSL family lipase [Pirellulaceae bacterium]
NKGNVKLLFIGDSITQGWELAGKDTWKKYYADRDAVNLGIGGDRTQHVLWRLDNGNIDGIEPKLAVVMIGTNNSGANTPKEIAEGVAAIVELLRTKLPKTTVLVLGIFPRGADANDARRPVIRKTNARLAKLADGKSVLYEDIGEVFLEPDGTIKREVMPDLLHLSPGSYERWAKAIEPTVARVLGDKPKTPPKD